MLIKGLGERKIKSELEKKKQVEKRTYMELATELSVSSALDEDFLINRKADQVERGFNGHIEEE